VCIFPVGLQRLLAVLSDLLELGTVPLSIPVFFDIELQRGSSPFPPRTFRIPEPLEPNLPPRGRLVFPPRRKPGIDTSSSQSNFFSPFSSLYEVSATLNSCSGSPSPPPPLPTRSPRDNLKAVFLFLVSYAFPPCAYLYPLPAPDTRL